MIRVFFDASVLFAASYSKTGSARDLLREAVRGNVQVVVTQHVLREAEASLARKAPEALPALHELLELVGPEVGELPTLQELREAATYINLKDAPIVAGAVKARVDYLVTWDRKHFIDDERVARESGLKIVTPDEVMTITQE
jgi:predicted nucleic acid-binding protein